MYFLTRPEEDEAAFAADLLGETGAPKAAVPLMLAAKSSSAKVRSAAVGALGSCGDTAATPLLIEALSDSAPVVRRKAAFSLGKLKDKRGITPLIPLLGDSCGFVRYSASYALSRIGDGEASEKLIARFSTDPKDRLEKYLIIETLGRLKDKKSLSLLLDLMDDQSYLTRGFACQALGHFRGKYEVANALKRSLDDSSGFVRMMAREALEAMRLE
jgi:HEAT repeat protein